jgi:pimeloyl-ACP methyl ester carboxylesterase
MARRWTAPAVALLTILVAAAAPAGPAAADPPAAPVAWAPCPAAPQVDCGTVTVPVDWSRPDGETIGIAVARRKATGPDATGRTLIYLPGGPGGSGVRELARMPRIPDAWQGFDLVSLDPRGVGASHPVRCDSDAVSAPYPQFPADQAEFDQLVAHNRALGESCRALTGPVFDFLDSASGVRDLEAIRAALGERQVTLHGVSYGTLLGQQYAARYPHRVRAAVLDSVLDHGTPGTAAFLTAQARAVQDSWDEFTAWCGRTPSCALHGQDADALLAALFEQSERGALVDPDLGPLSPLSLGALIAARHYGPAWGELAGSLVRWRDTVTPATPATRRALPAGPVPVHIVPGFGEPVPLATFAVFCQDWRLPVRDFAELDGHRRAMRAAAPDARFSPLGWMTTTGCLGWPAEVRNPQRPQRIRPGTPVLILNSRHDPATPWPWAENVAHTTGAQLLRYDGWGHAVVAQNVPCVTGHLRRFLTTGRAAAPYTRCAAVEPTA